MPLESELYPAQGVCVSQREDVLHVLDVVVHVSDGPDVKVAMGEPALNSQELGHINALGDAKDGA